MRCPYAVPDEQALPLSAFPPARTRLPPPGQAGTGRRQRRQQVCPAQAAPLSTYSLDGSLSTRSLAAAVCVVGMVGGGYSLVVGS